VVSYIPLSLNHDPVFAAQHLTILRLVTSSGGAAPAAPPKQTASPLAANMKTRWN
jgi:hypothetical protein